jgi:hypothetical protein
VRLSWRAGRLGARLLRRTIPAAVAVPPTARRSPRASPAAHPRRAQVHGRLHLVGVVGEGPQVHGCTEVGGAVEAQHLGQRAVGGGAPAGVRVHRDATRAARQLSQHRLLGAQHPGGQHRQRRPRPGRGGLGGGDLVAAAAAGLRLLIAGLLLAAVLLPAGVAPHSGDDACRALRSPDGGVDGGLAGGAHALALRQGGGRLGGAARRGAHRRQPGSPPGSGARRARAHLARQAHHPLPRRGLGRILLQRGEGGLGRVAHRPETRQQHGDGPQLGACCCAARAPPPPHPHSTPHTRTNTRSQAGLTSACVPAHSKWNESWQEAHWMRGRPRSGNLHTGQNQGSVSGGAPCCSRK